MFIVSATATSSFVFQRDGGRTSIEMLQLASRRPAEKQKKNRWVGNFSYKHGTPTGFWAAGRGFGSCRDPAFRISFLEIHHSKMWVMTRAKATRLPSATAPRFPTRLLQ